MQIIDNIPVNGTAVDEGAMKQIRNCARTAAQVPEVLAEHEDTIRVLHTLRPIGVAMAAVPSASLWRCRPADRIADFQSADRSSSLLSVTSY
jgi:hypothetical protein